MKSRLNLKPGQKGTKQLTEQYGEKLLYVRYRYDEVRGVRLKTVELVVEGTPWVPTVRLRDGDLVPLAVGYGEKELRSQVKAAGGKWDPLAKVWHVPYGAIKGTELEKKIPTSLRRGRPKKQAPHTE
jgi:hypothetical protein